MALSSAADPSKSLWLRSISSFSLPIAASTLRTGFIAVLQQEVLHVEAGRGEMIVHHPPAAAVWRAINR